jgi:four helix bundle protein
LAVQPYERFGAWKACDELAVAIFRASRQWPVEERFGLSAQARRAAFSAAANIVEGAARRGRREFRYFLNVSVASLSELGYILRLMRRLGITNGRVSDELEALRESAAKLTWLLYRSVSRSVG